MNCVLQTQIEKDSENVAWIVGVKTKVREIVLDKLEYGWSPEEIHFQHPHLSLAQIHAAFAYYYENQAEVDAEIKQSLADGEALMKQLSNAEFRRGIFQLVPNPNS